jgi:hypothetical protein
MVEIYFKKRVLPTIDPSATVVKGMTVPASRPANVRAI